MIPRGKEENAKLYEGRTWATTPAQTTSTHININKGNGGKTLLLCISGHTSTGNNTYSGMYMIRCGYNGNNYNKTTIVEDKGESGAIYTDITVNSLGEICYQVNSGCAVVCIYALT